MAGITYDTGALIAAERNDRRMWALHAAFLAEEVIPVVPAPVLAEAWRGGPRQASLARLMAMCEVEEMTEEQAHAVGVLAGTSGHDDIVDVYRNHPVLQQIRAAEFGGKCGRAQRAGASRPDGTA